MCYDPLVSYSHQAVKAAGWHDLQERGDGLNPLIKWVGSKRREMDHVLPLVQSRYRKDRTYWEPFLGSGSVFFALAPHRAVVGDVLPSLVDLYRAVQIDPDAVHEVLQRLLDRGHTEALFEEVRRETYKDVFESAARTLYLNRAAFNGVWRESSQGFNAPIGRDSKSDTILSTEVLRDRMPSKALLRQASRRLRHAVVWESGWERLVRSMRPGDVAFVDPPYSATYQGYAHGGRVPYAYLARVMRTKWEEGCQFVITMDKHTAFEKALEGWTERAPLRRVTTVGGDAGVSGDVKQWIWCSVPSPKNT